ncbi:MAG: DUF1801 domain-containing protein [Candidatus Marinimicrobia bacterium]|nr:DUF1801 domain-containing protein [Candidatus Neomarinimicrobiota bacterium]
MQYKTKTILEYISQLPEDRKPPISKLRNVINQNIDKGFSEEINYGMIGWVVPHSLYPDGYHCDPKLPLPFLNIASQKHFVAVYHMGIYASPKLLKWFIREYPKHCSTKLDMGKSCIRFKKLESIPCDLIGELASKMSAEEWIQLYESNVKDSRKRKI